MPSTTRGVTKTPLAMPVTSFSRPAVVICSVSSASGIPLSCPDISSFWRMPGAGSQRRANAAPEKDGGGHQGQQRPEDAAALDGGGHARHRGRSAFEGG